MTCGDHSAIFCSPSRPKTFESQAFAKTAKGMASVELAKPSPHYCRIATNSTGLRPYPWPWASKPPGGIDLQLCGRVGSNVGDSQPADARFQLERGDEKRAE